jgi:hypothetical protein
MRFKRGGEYGNPKTRLWACFWRFFEVLSSVDKQDIADIKALLQQIADNTKPPHLVWRVFIAIGTIATAASIVSIFEFVRDFFAK